jgi:membrane protease YdiL (CAAX protease family)
MPQSWLKVARVLAIVLVLFIATYAPAFVVVALAKLPFEQTVPFIIGVSLTMAILLMRLGSGYTTWAEFGLRACRVRYIVAATVIGAPVGWLAELVNRLTSASSVPEPPLPMWMKLLYFVVGAAIQEEVIFRGLLQTNFARRLPDTFSIAGASFSYAAIIIAVLFGLIHLRVNPITAASAFVLGVIAGEFRSRSGSILPAILVHAIFNGFAAIM